MKYLLSIALGPVQDFIAAARKTRDLYAGSWILSEISKAAGLKLIDEQADLIFPAAGPAELTAGSEFRAVNRLLAIVKTGDPAKLADEVRNSAMARLLSLGEIGDISPVRYDESLVRKHLAGSLEFYAAWVPFEGVESYKEHRRQVEQLLASRKLLNAFPQHEGKGGRRKSSLDGARETVIEHRGKRPSDLITLREGEELDGAGLLKRFVKVSNREARFESTIELAGMPYEKKINRLAHENEEIKLAFTKIKNFAEKAGLAGDKAELLYEHESREIFDSDDDRAELKALRDTLYGLCGRPDAPYFALLAADGDSMGERISALGLEEHKELSRRMSAFANQVRGRLIELECMPVFAGGDDVRAAIPLHRLLHAVEAVRATFREIVQVERAQFTLSAGVAIVHALDPLDEGMRAAKAAEKEAKEVPGKNAICFTVIPRTGAPVTATGPWDNTLRLLSDIDRAFRGSRLSFGFAHELRELLGRAHSDLDSVLPDLARAIAQKKKKEDSAAPALVKSACDRRGGEIREGLDHLVNCMLVTRKLSRACSEAFGEPDVQSDEVHRSKEQ